MAKALPIFSSFSSGEITPRLASRADVDAYKNGCAILRNMISTSHGPVMRRYGFRHIYNQPETDVSVNGAIVNARVFGFSVTKSLGTFVTVFEYADGTTKIAPYSPDGNIIPPSIELVKNPRFENGSDDWTDISLGTGTTLFSSGQAILSPGAPNQSISYSDTWTSKTGVPPTAGEVVITATQIDIWDSSNTLVDRSSPLLALKTGDSFRVKESGDNSRYSIYTVTADAVDNTDYVTIPVTEIESGGAIRVPQNITTEWISTLPGTNQAGIEQEITGTVATNDTRLRINGSNNAVFTPLRVQVGTAQGLSDLVDETITGRDIDISFEAGGTSVWFRCFVEEGADNRGVLHVSVVDETVNAPIDQDVVFDAPWLSRDMEGLQADSPPEGDILYFASKHTAPWKLTYDVATDGWTFEEVTFTAQPAEWVADNYPRAITFFQGRMWLGGTPKERETFWASKSADIENFTQGSLADDSLEFTLSEQGEIEWIIGAKNLIIGTANGEHIVQSAGGIIIPSDIEIIQQSAYGSKAIQAEKIGQKVMYVSPDGRKVREIGYQWTDDGWISRDISFTSEHITDANHIKQVAFAQNPDNLFWCATNAGELVCCTYEKTYNIIGWHRHDTGGDILDVATFDLNGTSLTGFMVMRNIEGEQRVSLEYIDPYDTFRMDNWKYQYYEEKTNIITGLEHLAGNTVDILTDSGVHPPTPVQANGEVYLQWEAKEVVCGHNFHSQIRTLSPEVIGSEGATHAMNKGWNRIVVRILDSGKPIINGVRPADRHPATPMDTPEPTRTEDVEVADLGYESWSSIDVEQDEPVKLMVLGIFGEQERDNL